MAARADPALGEVIEAAQLVIPDGAGVVWALGRQGLRVPRSPGIELAWALLQQAAEQAIAWLPQQLDPATRAAFGLHSPRVHAGKIITGDRFVATAAESRALRAELSEALAVDMESAAVAQVCHDYSVPFCAVRTISDRADDAAHVDFPAFLQRVARHYSGRMLETALRLL